MKHSYEITTHLYICYWGINLKIWLNGLGVVKMLCLPRNLFWFSYIVMFQFYINTLLSLMVHFVYFLLVVIEEIFR